MRLIPLLALTCLPLALPAADKEGSFAPKGAGLISCETFIAEQQAGSDAYLLFRGWIDGYLTGVNRYAPDTYDILPWETPGLIAAVIDSHCRDNPQARVMDVTMSVVQRLRDHRVRQQSDQIAVGEGDDRVLLYRSTVQRIQEALADQSLREAEPTGEFDEATRGQLQAYQREVGLPDTGLPDQQTLWRLLSPLSR